MSFTPGARIGESSTCNHLRFFFMRLFISFRKNATASILELRVSGWCARGAGDRPLVGLKSLMAPRVNSLNLPVVSRSLPSVLGEPVGPPSGNSGLLLAVNELPFFSWRDTYLTMQVEEVQLDICSSSVLFLSFTLYSSLLPCLWFHYLSFYGI